MNLYALPKIVWVHMLCSYFSLGLDKLSPKSHKCVFFRIH